jgi:hypothetical protein
MEVGKSISKAIDEGISGDLGVGCAPEHSADEPADTKPSSRP